MDTSTSNATQAALPDLNIPLTDEEYDMITEVWEQAQAAPVDETDDIEYQPLPAEYYGVDNSGGAAIIEDNETDWGAQDAYNAQWERDDTEAAYVATLTDKGTRLASWRGAIITED